MRKSLLVITFLIFSVVIVLVACNSEQVNKNGETNTKEEGSSEGEQIQLTIGAPPSSSAIYGYWVAATKAIESVYPEFNFSVTETSGAVDITERIKTGMVPIGNSVSSTDYENYYGKGDFEGEPFSDLRIIWYFDTTPMQWIVSKDSGIKELSDLDGENFNPGSTNSSAESITKLVMDELSISPNFFDAVQSDAEDAVVNRQIIGTSKAGPAPDSFIQQIQGSLDIELLGLSKDEVEGLTDNFGYLISDEIPAGTYEGIDHDVNTVSLLMGAQTTSELPQEVGYKMFKALWEDGKESWQDGYPVGADIDLPELTLQSDIPLHAGAVQYLEEIGKEVPENLIPPEYEEE